MKILLILLCITNFTFSKKKKKDIQESYPLDFKPEHYTYEYWCDICKETIKEISKRSEGKRKESDIIEVLENFCDRDIYKNESKLS
jgi:hypothetical protein